MLRDKRLALIIYNGALESAYYNGAIRALSSYNVKIRSIIETGCAGSFDTLVCDDIRELKTTDYKSFMKTAIEMIDEIEVDGVLYINDVAMIDLSREYLKHPRYISEISPSDSLVYEKYDRIEQSQLGYYDTLRVIEDLKGVRYYIAHIPDEQALIHKMAAITIERATTLKSIWPSMLQSPYRYLFEVVFAECAKILGIKEDFEYGDIYVGILEYYGLKLGISQFKKYDYTVFVETIIKALPAYKKEQPYEIALEMMIRLMI